MKFWMILIAMLLVPALARAQYLGGNQGYTIMRPGQMPSFVNGNSEDGYTIITPGEPSTFINPNGDGGYTVITPGEPPTFINPNGVGVPDLDGSNDSNGDDNDPGY